jgi:hypothetical protein
MTPGSEGPGEEPAPEGATEGVGVRIGRCIII